MSQVSYQTQHPKFKFISFLKFQFTIPKFKD